MLAASSVRQPLLLMLLSPFGIVGAQECSKAVSIYAMQKTGSTFLGRFSREIALHRKMCRTYQNNKEYVCQATLYVDCPRNDRHRKSVSLERGFSTQLPPSTPGRKCNSTLRGQLFKDANNWLRSTDVTVKYRYNKSLTWLLEADGFLRGPLRQVCRRDRYSQLCPNLRTAVTTCGMKWPMCPSLSAAVQRVRAQCCALLSILPKRHYRSHAPSGGDDGVLVLLHCRQEREAIEMHTSPC